MSAVWVLLTTFLLAQITFSAHVLPTPSRQHHFITELVKLNPDANRVGVDKCELCVEFANQAIDALLQFILRKFVGAVLTSSGSMDKHDSRTYPAELGVVDTCEDLCQVFADKTGSQALGVVCNILCDVVGINEFVKIIQKEDLDPIYYCELIPVCPVNDHGDAKFTIFEVSPKKGPQGTFNIAFEYVSVNGTGTGELDIECLTVDGIPIAICNGECGSKHPHSQIYDEAVTYFEITDDSRPR